VSIQYLPDFALALLRYRRKEDGLYACGYMQDFFNNAPAVNRLIIG